MGIEEDVDAWRALLSDQFIYGASGWQVKDSFWDS